MVASRQRVVPSVDGDPHGGVVPRKSSAAATSAKWIVLLLFVGAALAALGMAIFMMVDKPTSDTVVKTTTTEQLVLQATPLIVGSDVATEGGVWEQMVSFEVDEDDEFIPPLGGGGGGAAAKGGVMSRGGSVGDDMSMDVDWFDPELRTADGANIHVDVSNPRMVINRGAVIFDGSDVLVDSSVQVTKHTYLGSTSAGSVNATTVQVHGEDGLQVASDTTVGGSLHVHQNTQVNGDVSAAGDVSVGGALSADGAASVQSLSTQGDASVGGDVSVDGKLTVSGEARFKGKVVVEDELIVHKETVFKTSSEILETLSVVEDAKLAHTRVSTDNMGTAALHVKHTGSDGAVALDVEAGDARFNGSLSTTGTLHALGRAEVGGNLDVASGRVDAGTVTVSADDAPAHWVVGTNPSDHFATLAQALASPLVKDGNVVHLRAGTHPLGDGVTIDRALFLRGEGSANTILRAGQSGSPSAVKNAILITASGVYLESLAVEHYTTEPDASAIYAASTGTVHVRDVHVVATQRAVRVRGYNWTLSEIDVDLWSGFSFAACQPVMIESAAGECVVRNLHVSSQKGTEDTTYRETVLLAYGGTAPAAPVYSGVLAIDGVTHASGLSPKRLLTQEQFPTDAAPDSLHLVVRNCLSVGTEAFMWIVPPAQHTLDAFARVILYEVSMKAWGSFGMIAIDARALSPGQALRIENRALPFYIRNSTIASGAFSETPKWEPAGPAGMASLIGVRKPAGGIQDPVVHVFDFLPAVPLAPAPRLASFLSGHALATVAVPSGARGLAVYTDGNDDVAVHVSRGKTVLQRLELEGSLHFAPDSDPMISVDLSEASELIHVSPLDNGATLIRASPVRDGSLLKADSGGANMWTAGNLVDLQPRANAADLNAVHVAPSVGGDPSASVRGVNVELPADAGADSRGIRVDAGSAANVAVEVVQGDTRVQTLATAGKATLNSVEVQDGMSAVCGTDSATACAFENMVAVDGNVEITGDLSVAGTLNFGDTEFEGQNDFYGNVIMHKQNKEETETRTLVVNRGSTFNDVVSITDTLTVSGESTFGGSVTLAQEVVIPDGQDVGGNDLILDVRRKSDFNNAVDVSGDLTSKTKLVSEGTAEFDGETTFYGKVVLTKEDKGAVERRLEVNRETDMTELVTMTGGVDVDSAATFKGPVTVELAIDPGTGDPLPLKVERPLDVTASTILRQSLTTKGTTTSQGKVFATGGIDVSDGAVVTGGLTASGGTTINNAFTVNNGMTVSETATFNNDVTVAGTLTSSATFASTGTANLNNVNIGGTLGVTGATTVNALNVNGVTNVNAASNFNQLASFNNIVQIDSGAAEPALHIGTQAGNRALHVESGKTQLDSETTVHFDSSTDPALLLKNAAGTALHVEQGDARFDEDVRVDGESEFKGKVDIELADSSDPALTISNTGANRVGLRVADGTAEFKGGDVEVDNTLNLQAGAGETAIEVHNEAFADLRRTRIDTAVSGDALWIRAETDSDNAININRGKLHAKATDIDGVLSVRDTTGAETRLTVDPTHVRVHTDFQVDGVSEINGNTNIEGNLFVDGSITVTGDKFIKETGTVLEKAEFRGDVEILANSEFDVRSRTHIDMDEGTGYALKLTRENGGTTYGALHIDGGFARVEGGNADSASLVLANAGNTALQVESGETHLKNTVVDGLLTADRAEIEFSTGGTPALKVEHTVDDNTAIEVVKGETHLKRVVASDAESDPVLEVANTGAGPALKVTSGRSEFDERVTVEIDSGDNAMTLNQQGAGDALRVQSGSSTFNDEVVVNTDGDNALTLNQQGAGDALRVQSGSSTFNDEVVVNTDGDPAKVGVKVQAHTVGRAIEVESGETVLRAADVRETLGVQLKATFEDEVEVKGLSNLAQTTVGHDVEDETALTVSHDLGGTETALHVTQGKAVFAGDVELSGSSTLSVNDGTTTLGGTLDVTGKATFLAEVEVKDGQNLVVGTGATELGGTLDVSGETTFKDKVEIEDGHNLEVGTGNTNLGGPLTVTGGTTLGSTLTVTGVSNLNGHTNTETLDVGGAFKAEALATFKGTADFKDAVDLDTSANALVTTLLRVAAEPTKQALHVVSGSVDIDTVTTIDRESVGDTALTVKNNMGRALHVKQGSAVFAGDVELSGSSTLSVNDGTTTLGGTLDVTGKATFLAEVEVKDGQNLVVGTGATELGGTLDVSGETTFKDKVEIEDGHNLEVGTGNTNLGGPLTVTGGTTLGSTLTVTGVSNLNGHTNTETLDVGGAFKAEASATFEGTAVFKDVVDLDTSANALVTTLLRVAAEPTKQALHVVSGSVDIDTVTTIDRESVGDTALTVKNNMGRALHVKQGSAVFDGVVTVNGVSEFWDPVDMLVTDNEAMALRLRSTGADGVALRVDDGVVEFDGGNVEVHSTLRLEAAEDDTAVDVVAESIANLKRTRIETTKEENALEITAATTSDTALAITRGRLEAKATDVDGTLRVRDADGVVTRLTVDTNGVTANAMFIAEGGADFKEDVDFQKDVEIFGNLIVHEKKTTKGDKEVEGKTTLKDDLTVESGADILFESPTHMNVPSNNFFALRVTGNDGSEITHGAIHVISGTTRLETNSDVAASLVVDNEATSGFALKVPRGKTELQATDVTGLLEADRAKIESDASGTPALKVEHTDGVALHVTGGSSVFDDVVRIKKTGSTAALEVENEGAGRALHVPGGESLFSDKVTMQQTDGGSSKDVLVLSNAGDGKALHIMNGDVEFGNGVDVTFNAGVTFEDEVTIAITDTGKKALTLTVPNGETALEVTGRGRSILKQTEISAIDGGVSALTLSHTSTTEKSLDVTGGVIRVGVTTSVPAMIITNTGNNEALRLIASGASDTNALHVKEGNAKFGDNVLVEGKTTLGETVVSLESQTFVPLIVSNTQDDTGRRRKALQVDEGILLVGEELSGPFSTHTSGIHMTVRDFRFDAHKEGENSVKMLITNSEANDSLEDIILHVKHGQSRFESNVVVERAEDDRVALHVSKGRTVFGSSTAGAADGVNVRSQDFTFDTDSVSGLKMEVIGQTAEVVFEISAGRARFAHQATFDGEIIANDPSTFNDVVDMENRLTVDGDMGATGNTLVTINRTGATAGTALNVIGSNEAHTALKVESGETDLSTTRITSPAAEENTLEVGPGTVSALRFTDTASTNIQGSLQYAGAKFMHIPVMSEGTAIEIDTYSRGTVLKVSSGNIAWSQNHVVDLSPEVNIITGNYALVHMEPTIDAGASVFRGLDIKWPGNANSNSRPIRVDRDNAAQVAVEILNGKTIVESLDTKGDVEIQDNNKLTVKGTAGDIVLESNLDSNLLTLPPPGESQHAISIENVNNAASRGIHIGGVGSTTSRGINIDNIGNQGIGLRATVSDMLGTAVTLHTIVNGATLLKTIGGQVGDKHIEAARGIDAESYSMNVDTTEGLQNARRGIIYVNTNCDFNGYREGEMIIVRCVAGVSQTCLCANNTLENEDVALFVVVNPYVPVAFKVGN